MLVKPNHSDYAPLTDAEVSDIFPVSEQREAAQAFGLSTLDTHLKGLTNQALAEIGAVLNMPIGATQVKDHYVHQGVYELSAFTVSPDESTFVSASPIVQYVDTEGNLQTWGADNYHVDYQGSRATVAPLDNRYIADVGYRLSRNPIVITYTGGYDLKGDLAPIREACRVFIQNAQNSPDLLGNYRRIRGFFNSRLAHFSI